MTHKPLTLGQTTGPIPFALWDAPKGGRVVGRSTTGLWSDVEWIEGPTGAPPPSWSPLSRRRSRELKDV